MYEINDLITTGIVGLLIGFIGGTAFGLKVRATVKSISGTVSVSSMPTSKSPGRRVKTA